MVDLVLGTRAELEQAGFDHGPLSVIAKLARQGFDPPSRATVARIFSRAGVVVPQPRKKPRSAYLRFVYPQPNACWQIDSTEWVLADGTKVAIFQLVDDHSRLALASSVATGETSEAAIAIVTLAIQRHGVPEKFLSDNGAALNPTRRGRTGALVEFLTVRGVQPVTGKPYKPTTQGKNERFHQTLHRYLRRQAPAASMEILQAQIDTFDRYYNTERVHQALDAGQTPQEAWNATPKAPAPTPPSASGESQPRTPRHATTRRPPGMRHRPGNPLQNGQGTHRHDRARHLRRRHHHLLRTARHRDHQPPQTTEGNPLRRQRKALRHHGRPRWSTQKTNTLPTKIQPHAGPQRADHHHKLSKRHETPTVYANVRHEVSMSP
jgi:transposase InsO family protein